MVSVLQRRKPKCALRVCVVLGLIWVTTCGAEGTFTTPERDTALIPQNTAPQVLDFANFAAFNLLNNMEVSRQGLVAEDFLAAYVDEAFITVAIPRSGQDVTFMRTIDMYIEAPNQARRLLAHGDSFEAGSAVAPLVPVGDNLRDVVLADGAKVTVEVDMQPVPVDLTLDGQVNFRLVDKQLKALCRP